MIRAAALMPGNSVPFRVTFVAWLATITKRNNTQPHTASEKCAVSFSLNFPEKLEKQMRHRGLSARALAEALNVSNATVSGWLHGAAPRPEKLKELAEYLRVPLDLLIDDSAELPFDEYLEGLRGSVQEAQAAYPDNPEARMHAFDYLNEEKHRKRMAERLKKVIGELAEIASLMDTSDNRLARIAQELRPAKKSGA